MISGPAGTRLGIRDRRRIAFDADGGRLHGLRRTSRHVPRSPTTPRISSPTRQVALHPVLVGTAIQAKIMDKIAADTPPNTMNELHDSRRDAHRFRTRGSATAGGAIADPDRCLADDYGAEARLQGLLEPALRSDGAGGAGAP